MVEDIMFALQIPECKIFKSYSLKQLCWLLLNLFEITKVRYRPCSKPDSTIYLEWEWDSLVVTCL